MATIKDNVKEQITSEVNLFGKIMKHNVMENKFICWYALLR